MCVAQTEALDLPLDYLEKKIKANSGLWQSLRQPGEGGGNAGLSPGHVNVVHSNQNVGFFFYYFKLLCPEKI